MVEAVLARLVTFPSVVARVHRPDEDITRGELDECLAIILALGERLCI